MFPLALLLHQAGYEVSGSDSNCSKERLDLLLANGIRVQAAAMRDVDGVIVSPAIPESHAELRAARRDSIPVQTRARALAELIAQRPSICVAGSHGKSTTTAMLVHILDYAGPSDCGHMLGASFACGTLPPARLGKADAPVVIEACEAHGALACWQPAHAIVTNVDDDHANHYGGTDGLTAAFGSFLSRVPVGGAVVACGDDAGVADLLRRTRNAALTYGFGEGNLLRATEVGPKRIALTLRGAELGTLTLSIPGRHNLLNAMGALGMALSLGVGFETAAAALAGFRGIARRLQRVPAKQSLRVFDDFAHHPSEVAASIAVLREGAAGRLIAVFEPQLHSRVSRMALRFAEALSAAELSFILPVAAHGESARGQDGDAALKAAARSLALSAVSVSGRAELLVRLQDNLRPDDTIVVMAGGSGDGLAGWLGENLIPASPSTSCVLVGETTPVARDLIGIVAGHAARNPAAPALEMGHRRLSYGELACRVRDLAAALGAAGVGAGDNVGVCIGRSVDRVSSFLAILQMGAVFVPLDPALPEERLRHVLNSTDMRLVIVNAASPALPDMELDFVVLDRLPEVAGPPEFGWQPDDCAGDAPAYIIFTSGTSGQPKGVVLSRAALANYAVAAARHFELGASARVSQLSGFGFDVSVGDMAMSLAAGACLVFPTDAQGLPGPAVGRFIDQARLTHLSLTPSALTIIPQADRPELTHIIVAGEACRPALVEQWGRGRTFINAYGPTEATIEALFTRCEPGHPVTIGRPIDNMGACLLTQDLQPVARGEEGELCLFGRGLALGYLDQPELTARQFPTVDIPGQGPVRIYRTGDRAKATAEGGFICLGRIDDQVKINGHRIEPAEIEAVLCEQPDVVDASVSLLAAESMPDRLIAHVVMRRGIGTFDPLALRESLSKRLPATMIPSAFLPVPELPLNANGKRNRSALPLPPFLTEPPAARTVGTATEARLMALIDANVGQHRLAGVRDSFDRAGIDSLSMAALLFAVEDAFDVRLDIDFEPGRDTVEILALMVEARLNAPSRAVPDDLDVPEDGLADKLAPYLATWPGERLGRKGLVRSLAPQKLGPKLFWCFQTGSEFAQLSTALQEAATLFGLRSGHLAVEYNDETLSALGRLYADEIETVSPSGALSIGGNCQGGIVTRAAGLELMRRGREVALTILMEQGRFLLYPGETLLLFGAGSYLNPYGQIDAPEQLFRAAYSGGHKVEIIPGTHGSYFTPENVGALAETILRHMTRVRCAQQNPPAAVRPAERPVCTAEM